MFDVRTLLATAEGLFGEQRKCVQVRQMGSKKKKKEKGGEDLVSVCFKGLRLVTLEANANIFKITRLRWWKKKKQW